MPNYRKTLAAAICCFSALAVLLISGCGAAVQDEASEMPYGDPDASGTVHVVLDSRLEYNASEYDKLVEDHLKPNMSNVDYAPQQYMSISDIERAIADGDDIDIVVVPYAEMDKLQEQGYIGKNEKALDVGKVPVVGSPRLRVVRKMGSKASLPDTRLVGGDDNASSGEWRLAYLPGSGLKIAVLPDDDSAGIAANQTLASVGLYSEESGTGGSYADTIAGDVTVAEGGEEAMDLVRNGSCDIAFLCDWDVESERASGVEAFYEVPGNLYQEALHFKAGVLKSSSNKAAARSWISIAYWL